MTADTGPTGDTGPAAGVATFGYVYHLATAATDDTVTAGDTLTLRNNSATPFTMDLAPGVGAQFDAILLS